MVLNGFENISKSALLFIPQMLFPLRFFFFKTEFSYTVSHILICVIIYASLCSKLESKSPI